jgi:hypothetical protein
MSTGQELLAAVRPLGGAAESVLPHIASLKESWLPVLGETLDQGEVLLPKVLQVLEKAQPGVGPHSVARLGARFVQELALRQAADPVASLAPSAPLTPPPELTLSSTAGLPLGPPSSGAPLPGAPPPKRRPFPMPEEPFVPAEDANWPPERDAEGPVEASFEPTPEPEGPPPLTGPPGAAREAQPQAPSGARALPLVMIGVVVAVLVLTSLIVAVAIGAMLLTV